MLLKELETDSIPIDELEEVGMNWLTANRNILAPKTTNRRLTSLKQLAKFIGRPDMFSEYAAPHALRGTPHPLPEGIDGVKRMVRVCHSEKHKALVALCGFCGLRVAEALEVKPSDFDLTNMLLKVRGKGGRYRIVPVSSLAWDALQYPVTRAFIEGDREVVGLKDRFARQLITTLAARAGLSRSVASHDLRATFATEVYNKTLNVSFKNCLVTQAAPLPRFTLSATLTNSAMELSCNPDPTKSGKRKWITPRCLLLRR